MTAIIACSDGETVWIGGDSGATDSTWSRITTSERKVFHIDELLIGICGTLAIGELMHYGLKLEPRDPKQLRGIEYLNIVFIPALKALLKAHDEPMHTDTRSTGLTIGYRGNLYTMDSHFHITKPRDQISRDGAGGDLAFAGFLAYRHAGKTIADAMMMGLAIAGEHNMTVEPPYYVLRTESADNHD